MVLKGSGSDLLIASIAKLRSARSAAFCLVAIVAIAALLRLWNLSFDTPSIFDVDEPFFLLKSIELLRGETMNPEWFGHPGTTTIYALSLIGASLAIWNIAGGHYETLQAFGESLFYDPTPFVVAARGFIVLCGLVCVVLTYWVGRRLYGTVGGLFAAVFLALNPLHVEFSQIIRPDVHAGMFLLLAIMMTLLFHDSQRRGYLIWAGVFVGLASATKWPAALAILVPFSLIISSRTANWLVRSSCKVAPKAASNWDWSYNLIILSIASLVGLVIGSPYLLIEWDTVLANLIGEVRTVHPGTTGFGLWGNMEFYATQAFLPAFGVLALGFGIVGIVHAGFGVAFALSRRSVTQEHDNAEQQNNQLAGILLLPLFFMYIVMTALHPLVRVRWIVIILPVFCLFAAGGLVFIAKLIAKLITHRLSDLSAQENSKWVKFKSLAFTLWPPAIAAMLLGLSSISMIQALLQNNTEKAHDTRLEAIAWAKENISPNKSVLIEFFAFALSRQPWELRFPAASIGCVEPMGLLTANVSFASTEKWRQKAAVVDIGSVALDHISGCETDYAILTNYARYRSDPVRFAQELKRYRHIIDQSDVVRIFRNEPGRKGGPEIWITRKTASRDISAKSAIEKNTDSSDRNPG